MPTAAENPRPAVEQTVYAQQVGLLYGYAPLAYSAALINGLILIFVQRAHFPPTVLLGWFAGLALVTAGRIGLVYRYHRVHPAPAVARRWAWRYGIGVGLAGITWGSAAVLLFPPDAIGPQVMVAFVLAGMTAAGLLVLAARFEVVVVFLLPALLPLILQFFLQNSELHTAMGIMTLLYLGGLLGIAAKMHRLIADVLSLRVDNHALVEEVGRRQRAEDGLRESEARLQRVLDGANDGFWDWNVATGAVLVSRHGIEMLGYQPDDLAPHIASWEMLVHPDDRPLRRPALAAHFAGETPRYQAEYRLRAKAGDWRWVLVRGKVTARDATGRPLWMAGTHTDITDRHLIEEALCDTLVRMQRRADQMSALNRMNDLLLSCETRAKAYQIIACGAARLFDGNSGGLAIREDASPDPLRVVATWGVAPPWSATVPARDCEALRQGGLYEIRDPAHGVPCRHCSRAAEHAYLCLPLIVRGETLGLLQVGAGGALADEQFQDSRTLALTVGESIKLALSNLKLQEALREQAVRDPLTGLFNRRYLDETLPRELHRCLRSGEPLVAAMLDLDHFKRVNDACGHEAGDTLLRAVGHLLRDFLRVGDLACRYGGEELTVILPGSSLENARVRLDGLRQAVRQLHVGYPDGALPAITVSIGVAAAAPAETDAAALLGRADAALYRAKAQGRNRVAVADLAVAEPCNGARSG